jgi:CheY-like chemotaxis protein
MPKKVLVVDDEPDVVRYFTLVLEEQGYQTCSAANGVEAMQKVEAEHPDLVTLDITMPEKSGVRVYRQLKSDQRLKKIPVLIVTGVPHEFRRFISTRRQVPPPEGYLDKPTLLGDLVDEVNRLLGKQPLLN